MTEREVTLLRDFITWQSLPFVDNVFSTRDETIKHFNEWLIQVSGNQQPSEDCISRQQKIKKARKGLYLDDVITELKWLPSVTPQRPKGKWIFGESMDGASCYMCSNCKEIEYVNYYDYCPNCGAKMEEE